ncbi:NAD(P)H-dependent flavin oxidoreductase [Pseudoalteromonas piscicida]|uniref:Nitronate monooxygenase n=1 Tax=Pseudoalteromonas piscicida TaxID=43662 RepID=A0A2A5JUA5_PSEO7|nr:nitronate monooxygenase [Pseudoalteromonas piscicida]PCK32919.1 2-nitropropane dioxygenase [Pseudoalteromonas piscicida]
MQLSKLLNIAIPMIQAPMAGVQNWRLAAAASNAGILGSIPCGMLSKAQVIEEIENFKAHASGPYNLNFFCHEMPELDPYQQDKWKQKLSAYYDEFNVEPNENLGVLRRPFDMEMAEAIAPYKPSVISFHFGLPDAALVEFVKSWGAKILSSATTLEEGIWLAENGADIVIAQGIEAGGHRATFTETKLESQLHTRQLVTILADALSVPVIAAGGIASHHDVIMMHELGACGTQIGTCFLLCDEADTSQVHRNALKSLAEPSAVTNVFSGRPARGIENRLMIDLSFINSEVPAFPYASAALAPLRATAEEQGKGDFSPLWSGVNRQGCKEVSIQEVVENLWTDKLINT